MMLEENVTECKKALNNSSAAAEAAKSTSEQEIFWAVNK